LKAPFTGKQNKVRTISLAMLDNDYKIFIIAAGADRRAEKP